LKIEHQLDPVECEILDRTKECVPLAELIRTLGDLDVDEPTVMMAVRSLLRRRLVRLDERNPPQVRAPLMASGAEAVPQTGNSSLLRLA
jgi:hypothetical protein